jgi:hypothetical protein
MPSDGRRLEIPGKGREYSATGKYSGPFLVHERIRDLQCVSRLYNPQGEDLGSCPGRMPVQIRGHITGSGNCPVRTVS